MVLRFVPFAPCGCRLSSLLLRIPPHVPNVFFHSEADKNFQLLVRSVAGYGSELLGTQASTSPGLVLAWGNRLAAGWSPPPSPEEAKVLSQVITNLSIYQKRVRFAIMS